jgi:hypothetical protein
VRQPGGPGPEQTAVEDGRATDRAGVPLPFATIKTDRALGYADAQGRFRIVDLPGSYVVTVEYPGFESATQRVTFVRGKPPTINARLVGRSTSISEPVAAGRAPLRRRLSVWQSDRRRVPGERRIASAAPTRKVAKFVRATGAGVVTSARL